MSSTPANPAPLRARMRGILCRCLSGLDWAFGLLSLVVGLALLAAIPVLNLAAFGYLLHAGAQVARTGRFRDGLVGIRKASRLGSLALGTFLLFIPVRIVAGLWRDAEVVAPGSTRAGQWRLALLVLVTLTLVHVGWAWIRGGRLHHFAWPAPVRFIRWIRGSGRLADCVTAVVGFVTGLRPVFYFWLGTRGFVGTFLWLAIPVGLLIAAAGMPVDKGGALLTLLGGVLTMIVVVRLPFLQVHFALEDRFRAFIELRTVTAMVGAAPIAAWIALLATVVSALPLYLLKIELPPRELTWLPALAFVVFILPARLLTGWAVGRGRRHGRPRHGLIRWPCRLAAVPIAFAYVLVVYLNQYVSWNGSRGMLEQHAFLVPAPVQTRQ